MSFEIKNSKTADISNSIHMDRELAEKIDDLVAAIWERKPKQERRGQHTQYFLHKYGYLQIIQRTKLSFNLIVSSA